MCGGEYREVLGELLALRELKQKAERTEFPAEWTAQEIMAAKRERRAHFEEYKRRKQVAWMKARELYNRKEEG